MKRTAFTLIELAIALTIIGIIIGGSIQAVKSMREKSKVAEAKEQVRASKDAILGYVGIWPNLPTGTEFQNDLSPIKNNQHAIFYAPDTVLSTNDICAYNTTALKVIDNGVSPLRTIDNVAFVVVHEGANHNMQTVLNGSNEVHIYGASTQVDDNTTPVNIVEQYDDIVEWVTLDELKENVNCNDKPFRFINDRLPHGDYNTSYNATLYVENNVSFVNIVCTPSLNHNINFSDPVFSGIPNSAGTALFSCTAAETSPATRTITKQYIITIDP